MNRSLRALILMPFLVSVTAARLTLHQIRHMLSQTTGDARVLLDWGSSCPVTAETCADRFQVDSRFFPQYPIPHVRRHPRPVPDRIRRPGEASAPSSVAGLTSR